MRLFSFFKKDKRRDEKESEEETSTLPSKARDKGKDGRAKRKEDQPPEKIGGLDTIYQFLQDDFEAKGYADALVNPDERYKTDNFTLIRYDLQILLHQVGAYHDDLLQDIDFHIRSRTRLGLVDLVEELKNRKEMVHEHVRKVQEIKDELEQEKGMTQRVLLSYQRGFMKGLSAITQSNILDKKF